MPSGSIHYREWKGCWLHSLWGAAFVAVFNVLTGLGFLIGYLLGRFIEPDLDHRNMTTSEYRAMRELKIFGALFVAYWMPYGYLIPHRSPLSHYPFIGTSTRLLYQFWFIPLIIYNVGFLWNNVYNIVLFSIGLFGGLALSDIVHFLLDYGYLEYEK